jgi:hypothetical protein
VLRSRVLAALVAPLAAVSVVGLSACGTSDDGEVGNLSKAEFAAKANALCTTAEADRAQLLQELSPTPSGSADAGTLQRVVTVDRELVRHIDDLVPPEGEQDRVDRVLDAWRKRAELEEQYANEMRAMQAPQSLERFTADVAQIDASVAPIANDLGMTQCAPGAP